MVTTMTKRKEIAKSYTRPGHNAVYRADGFTYHKICFAKLNERQNWYELIVFVPKEARNHLTLYPDGNEDDFKPINKEYLHYVLNESAFSNIFIEKDVDTVLECGVEINLEDHDWRFVSNGLILLRLIWDVNWRGIRNFLDKYDFDLNFNEYTALCCSFMVNPKLNEYGDYVLPLQYDVRMTSGYGHSPFSGDVTFDQMVNLEGYRGSGNTFKNRDLGTDNLYHKSLYDVVLKTTKTRKNIPTLTEASYALCKSFEVQDGFSKKISLTEDDFVEIIPTFLKHIKGEQ